MEEDWIGEPRDVIYRYIYIYIVDGDLFPSPFLLPLYICG